MDGSVLAAWAGAAASLFGAGLTVWWPWHNRPQADWTLLEHSTNPELPISSTVPGFSDWLESRDEAEPDSVCSVYNSGDGDAYDVSIEGIGCKAYFLLLRPIGDNTEFMTPSSIAQFKAADRAYIIIAPSIAGCRRSSSSTEIGFMDSSGVSAGILMLISDSPFDSHFGERRLRFFFF